jgi:hypothetical protein
MTLKKGKYKSIVLTVKIWDGFASQLTLILNLCMILSKTSMCERWRGVQRMFLLNVLAYFITVFLTGM